ncbi:MAG: multidrug effflux MFS transporter [Actinobacteria bacterium]|nr:multidrug effflux MFS transporter [Actinomycetota bacterium]
METTSDLSRLSRSRRLGLIVVLGSICTIGPFSTDLYLPALPTVAADLGASSSAIALTVTTFLVGLALGQLLAGPLSDTYGRRLPLLVGLSVYTAASLVCALTPSADVLIAVRLVQGLAGASGMAIANAVVTDYSRGRQAARLLSRLALVSGLAPIVAPLVGAQLLRVTSWRGLYVALTGLGILLFSAVALGLRESLPREKRQAGGATRTLRTFGMLSCDLRFMGFASASALSFVAFFAYLAASSFVYQDLYGASPVLFSLLFATNAIGMLAVSQLNHRLLTRFSPRQLLGAGLMIGSLSGLAVLLVTLVGGLSIAALAVPLFVLVASLGFVFPDSTALALSLHPDVAGSASAYFGTFRLGLGALATPLVGIGGAVSGLPMAIIIAVSSAAALAVFAAVAARTRTLTPILDTPEEASADMPVG